MKPEDLFLAFFLGILFFIILFIILREFWTWYWKINARLSAQKDTTETLDNILEQLVFITNYIKKKDPTSQEVNYTGLTINDSKEKVD